MANVFYHLQTGAPAHPKTAEVYQFILENLPERVEVNLQRHDIGRVAPKIARLPCRSVMALELRYRSVKYPKDWLAGRVVFDGQDSRAGIWLAELIEKSPFSEELDPLVLNEAIKVLEVAGKFPEQISQLK